MQAHVPQRAAFCLSALAFCLASVMALSAGVSLISVGLRAMVAACIFGLVGYWFGLAIVNVVGEELFHDARRQSTAAPRSVAGTTAQGEATP